MENQGRERGGGRVVVLVPCPFQGHMSPMLELGTALHSKGFSITIAHTLFNSPNPSNHPHFTFLPISDRNTSSGGHFKDLVLTLNTNCEAPLKEHLTQMMDQERPPCVVIYDAIMYAGEIVATHLKIPTIVLRTSGASASVVFGSMPRLQEEGYFPLQDYKMQDLVPGLHPLRFKDLPISKFESLESLLQLISIVCNTRTSSAIIWNTADCLEHPALSEQQHHHQIPFFPIGPLFKTTSPSSTTSLLEENSICISWLDKQAPNSVLYISLGSVASVDETELAEMAWGLANSGQPFLWVIRPGSVRGSQWIELLPECFEDEVSGRGCIVKWAPQKEVLAHGRVGGFWSHCGWNSILESVSEGVPMICSPCFGDQKVNARYVSSVWKVGLELLGDELKRGEIERVVRRLMGEKEGEEIRQRATDLKREVEICVKEGGSSYKSLNDLVEFILSL